MGKHYLIARFEFEEAEAARVLMLTLISVFGTSLSLLVGEGHDIMALDLHF